MTARKTASEKIQDETSEEQSILETDVSDAPPLQPIATLRMAKRKAFMKLANGLSALGALTVEQTLDFVDSVDQALESVALDPTKYAAWAVGDNLESRIIALFAEYAAPLGDSMRSAS